MNIFKFELKMNIKNIILWSILYIGLLFMFMSFFPAFSQDMAVVDRFMSNYPPELLEAFGMANGLSLATLYGYFSFAFVFIQLCIAIQSSYYGFNFLSMEERELTADFLITKPVSRTKVNVSKFLAAFASLTITTIVITISSFIVIIIFRKDNVFEYTRLIQLLFTIPLFQLFFISIGMLLSVSLSRIRSVISYAMGLSFGLYVLNALKSIVGGKLFGYLSPFHHYDPGYILSNGHLNTSIVILSILLTIICLVTSYFLYNRRNIRSV